jgi:hypothetical protein
MSAADAYKVLSQLWRVCLVLLKLILTACGGYNVGGGRWFWARLVSCSVKNSDALSAAMLRLQAPGGEGWHGEQGAM